MTTRPRPDTSASLTAFAALWARSVSIGNCAGLMVAPSGTTTHLMNGDPLAASTSGVTTRGPMSSPEAPVRSRGSPSHMAAAGSVGRHRPEITRDWPPTSMVAPTAMSRSPAAAAESVASPGPFAQAPSVRVRFGSANCCADHITTRPGRAVPSRLALRGSETREVHTSMGMGEKPRVSVSRTRVSCCWAFSPILVCNWMPASPVAGFARADWAARVASRPELPSDPARIAVVSTTTAKRTATRVRPARRRRPAQAHHVVM